ncbi:protein of unknown function [Bartonella clarridgeiae 73]|uniref:Uncharacterized protein n=1 Tax=Bartonella clarridgeiae (strain CCUG 45776 / CIP 104772 / 73) TaxID=696125 RepID=E6YH76_BARC7|nr:MAG: hypothetical protein PG977_000599 [Bartonella clarridgeiae]CBI76214.1 protein of unknown function [Bartonella clarridgeiae 73]
MQWLDCYHYKGNNVIDLIVSPVYDDFEFYNISNKVNKITYTLPDIFEAVSLQNQTADLSNFQKNEQFDLF